MRANRHVLETKLFDILLQLCIIRVLTEQP